MYTRHRRSTTSNKSLPRTSTSFHFCASMSLHVCIIKNFRRPGDPDNSLSPTALSPTLYKSPTTAQQPLFHPSWKQILAVSSPDCFLPKGRDCSFLPEDRVTTLEIAKNTERWNLLQTPAPDK